MRFRYSLLSLVALLSCKSDITISNLPIQLTVAPTADTLVVGETATPFTAIAVNFEGDTITAEVAWSTNRADLALVNQVTGAISTLAVGEAWIVAETGSLRDSARLTILGPITLSLRLDTILLAPGDTFSIPVTALNLSGHPLSLTYAIDDTTVARVSAGGQLTALALGRTGFAVQADSFTVGGIVDVVTVLDTLGGQGYFVLRGAVERRVRMGSRWFQYSDGIGGSVVNIAARNAENTERLFTVVRDSILMPGLRTIGPFPAASSTVAICNPPNGWALYQDRRAGATIDAPSVLPGGTLSIQRVDPIPGGARVSATIEVLLERSPGDQVSVLGRFVVPLLSLTSCPG
ncbi:MAG: hypothetical protein WD934_02760 [Gemmatimonadales bacterium]